MDNSPELIDNMIAVVSDTAAFKSTSTSSPDQSGLWRIVGSAVAQHIRCFFATVFSGGGKMVASPPRLTSRPRAACRRLNTRSHCPKGEGEALFATDTHEIRDDAAIALPLVLGWNGSSSSHVQELFGITR